MKGLDNQQPSLQRKVQRLEQLLHECIGRMTDTEPYLRSIVGIRDKRTNATILYTTLTIQSIAAKYSNTKQPIYKLVIDDKPISRNNSYTVQYSCMTCGVHQEITLNLFTRKVNQGGSRCHSCVNKDAEKREVHSQFMLGTYEPPEKVSVKSLSLPDMLERSESDWSLEEEEFRDLYNRIHLSVEEFERIRPQIRDINHNKLTDLTSWEYVPHYRIWNQTRYVPMLIHRATNTIERPYYISFDCENCGEVFCHRDLEVVKNKLKVYCKDCSFTNKIFRIRTLTLKDGSKIRWQSVPERRFIEWCEEHRIPVRNGPKLPYTFRGVTKEYRVDFELPSHNQLVEIKDNHCWHKRQVESGQHSCKEAAANEWCKQNEYSYEVVFPKTIQAFKDRILSCKI